MNFPFSAKLTFPVSSILGQNHQVLSSNFGAKIQILLKVKSTSKWFFYSFQQDGRPTILSQMESSSEQFVEGVFPTFRQWAIHRCAFGHWKQKYPVSQSGIISLFQLLWTSLLDFWWEKSNHHPKGYLLWWYLGLSRVHVPWRNQCRPGKLQQAYCLDIFFLIFQNSYLKEKCWNFGVQIHVFLIL